MTLPPLGTVHVHWLSSHPLDPATELLLDPDERARAARFATPQLRARFTMFRGRLRRILAAYAGADPALLRLAYNEFGRPELATQPHLRFNLSHAEDVALLAVTRDRAVGIDLESRTRARDIHAIAEAVFTPPERSRLARCPRSHAADLFCRTWVRKEAFLKALGVGLVREPTTFTVDEDTAGRPVLLPGPDPADPGEPSRWRLLDLEVPSPFRAALCLEHHPTDPDPTVVRGDLHVADDHGILRP